MAGNRDNPIRYSDLVVPDSAVTDLIAQLERLQDVYSGMQRSIVREARAVEAGLKRVSGATEEGRQATQEAARKADDLARAQRNLARAQADNAKEIAALKKATQEKNRETMNAVRLEEAAAGSYNRLSALYSKLKTEYNAMSAAQREGTEYGRQLRAQLADLYAQMVRIQAATGKHQLSVGNYAKAFNGLNLATAQVVRELPSAAISLNTFFLAISNNIPILVDQINLLRAQNTALIAQGGKGISIVKAVAKSFFSWNTVLALVITGFTVFGEDIVKWIGNLFRGRKAVDDNTEALKRYNAALLDAQKEERKSITVSTLLYKAATDQSRSMEDRLSATRQLQKEYPGYLGNLSEESIMAGKAKGAYDRLTEALVENARTRAYLNAITEEQSKAVEIESRQAEAQEKLVEAEQELAKAEASVRQAMMGRDLSGTGIFGAAADIAALESVSPAAVKVATDRVAKLRKEISGYESELKAIYGSIDRLAGKIDTDYLTEDSAESRIGRGGSGATDRDRTLEFVRAAEDARIELMADGYRKELEMSRVRYEREIEDLKNTLATEENLTVEAREAINDNINSLVVQQAIEEWNIREKYRTEGLRKEQEDMRKSIEDRRKTIEDMASLEASMNSGIDSGFKAGMDTENFLYGTYTEQYDAEYELRMSEIDLMDSTEKEKTRLQLEATRKRLQQILNLNMSGLKQLSDNDLAILRNQIARIDQELEENARPEDFYDLLGINLSDEQKDALKEATDFILDQLSQIVDKQVEMAEQAVEDADRRVENAQNTLDAELEARNAGYANNVETARKELELAKQQQQQALAQRQKAQEAELAMDTATQASSLITAVANIWKAFSSLGVWGIAAAAVATAGMFAAFTASKIKAYQLVRQQNTETYGSGTVELLQGGSHQSGNDIDLGHRPDGTRRRAEGGEFFAVINRRSSRKYRSIIPDLINSLNRGTFLQQYSRAFPDMSVAVPAAESVDLGTLREDVRDISRQGRTRYYRNGSGNLVEVRGSRRRTYINR